MGERGDSRASALASETPTQPSPVRGGALGAISCQFDLRNEGLQHAIRVLQDVVVPEADHPVAVGFDQLGSRLVGRAIGVLPAIQLDCEPETAASEVDDRVADPEFAGELHAQLPAAQVPPPALLRFRGIGAELACNRS